MGADWADARRRQQTRLTDVPGTATRKRDGAGPPSNPIGGVEQLSIKE